MEKGKRFMQTDWTIPSPEIFPPGDPSPRRLLLLSASVGAGHNQAARALLEWLRRMAPHVAADCRDVLDFTPRRFRWKYAGGYAVLVSRFPRLYGIGYAVTDRPRGPRRSLMERRRLWSESRALQPLERWVEEFRPDAIVHTHFLAPPFLAKWIRRTAAPVKQYLVTTDVIPHRWWYCEDATLYFAAHDEGCERLVERGAPTDRILVSGIPIHPKWTDPLPPREEICRQWSLPPDRPVVLLSGGADFTCGPIVQIARGLVAACPRVCVVVLAGRNKKLLGQLAVLPETRRGWIVPQGFSDRVHELASVAEVMLTKAGGLTTAECLAKRLPMVFLPPVPGQERANAEFFARHGAGKIAGDARQAVALTAELLQCPETRAAMAEAAGKLHRPAAKTILSAILEKPA